MLYVEDNDRLGRAIRRVFRTYNIEVVIAQTAADATRQLEGRTFDILLVDANLPDSSGFDLCEQIRAEGLQTPIVIYTGAATAPEDIRRGLSMGADGYIVKPVDPDTLHLRLRAVLRAFERGQLVLRAGTCTLDRERHLLAYEDGSSIELMPKEGQVLAYLILHRGNTVSRDELLSRYWGSARLQTRAVDNVVARLRKFCRGAGFTIRAVRSEGYVLEEDD